MAQQNSFSGQFLAIVVVLQVIMYLALFLNFTIVRAVIGLFYLSFIPGLIFIKLLKFNFETSELVVYAAGFSLAFLMVTALVLNGFGPLVGITFPLTALPLSLVVNTVILGGAAIAYIRSSNKKTDTTPKPLGFHPSYVILTLIPVLTIVGANFVNTTGDNFY